jgi:hypothetical protein
MSARVCWGMKGRGEFVVRGCGRVTLGRRVGRSVIGREERKNIPETRGDRRIFLRQSS